MIVLLNFSALVAGKVLLDDKYYEFLSSEQEYAQEFKSIILT